MTHYQMRPSDRTEMVTADKLRPADWIVVPFEGWAWQLLNVTVDGDDVVLSSWSSVESGVRKARVCTSTMFVRRIVSRRINMRPDLEPAG